MLADQEEIHRLSLSDDQEDRLKASQVLIDEFGSLPDKSAAWDDLHRLTSDKDSGVRRSAAAALCFAFSSVPDKSAAWDDLHRLTSDKDSGVRRSAAAALGFVFSSVPDKSVAWDDLHKLINEEDIGVRYYAAYSLGFSFEYIPEKIAAWDDLHKLINDYYLGIRWIAVDALGSAFSFVPDKSVAWDDLHKLINDEDLSVRWHAVAALVSAFSSVPDKSAAWDDLHKLINDKDSGVRRSAADVLGSAFSSVPDKSVAWDDLHRLTSDKDSGVRRSAAAALGSAISFIPNEYKTIICSDLNKLAIDDDYSVRFYATYSLGKICIYNASKSENQVDSRALLEKAIQFFEKAIQFFEIDTLFETDTLESGGGSPAHFCYPFYCAFDAVLFKNINSKKEIENYIASARREIWGSKSKQKLIEAIEKLAEAIEIAHNAYESGNDWQETLKRCSDICNHAERLMDESKDMTPAIYDMYQIAKPSFDKRITELIDNIREKIEIGRDKAAGTPYQDLFNDAEKEVKYWKTGNDEENLAKIKQIIEVIRETMPPDKIEVVHNKLNKTIVERDLPNLLEVVLNMMQEIIFYSNSSKQGDEVKSMLNNLLMEVAKVKEDTTHMRKTTDKIDETVTRTENKVDLLLQTVNELKQIASNLKEEGNEKGSQDVNDIADKIKVLFDNKDPREITLFIEKLQKEVPDILGEIEKSTASNDVKEKAKRGLKDKIMETGKNIAFAVATNWIATYLPSIITAGASGLLVPGIILAVLVSIVNLRNQDLK